MAVKEEEEEEESDPGKGESTIDFRDQKEKDADLDWLFESQYREAHEWDRGEMFGFDNEKEPDAEELAEITQTAYYFGNVPPSWVDVLIGDMSPTQTAHIRHSAGGFMLLMKKTYQRLPIQYMRLLHRIIWEQTKMYLAGGLRGLNGLSLSLIHI